MVGLSENTYERCGQSAEVLVERELFVGGAFRYTLVENTCSEEGLCCGSLSE